MASKQNTWESEAALFKALGHPLRVAILEFLRGGERCVGEIADHLHAEQSNVSRHLGQLVNVGLLVHRKEGLNVYYRLASPVIIDLLARVREVSGTTAVTTGAPPIAAEKAAPPTPAEHAAIAAEVSAVLARHGISRDALLEIMRELQKRCGFISRLAMAEIARALGIRRIEVEDPASSYHFLSRERHGRYVIYLNDSITARMKGREEVARALEREFGIRFGETTPDGLVTLASTSCIGMSDQEPAALVNGVVVTELTPHKVKEIAAVIRRGEDPKTLVRELGDGHNASPAIHAMVRNNIRQAGPVLLAPYERGKAVRGALAMKPEEIINMITNSRLRGRGGAGFPTGMKWQFCRKAEGTKRYVIANADEGEPGTFKDRVLLTEAPDLLFDGMTVAAWAVGADEGILYLRAEYEYLRQYLEELLTERRCAGLLGTDVAGKKGFHFDIRIQMGAGAYVCGEESALIESMEGKRAAPRDRPPFPVEYGYRGMPTVVNNVETLCAAARIVVEGPGWFSTFGTEQSRGTKALSVSGDCARPGFYELPFGITVKEVLEKAGALEAKAAQVGGPSGVCINREQFGRQISFEDLPTGGSFIIFGPKRDLVEIAASFMDFFVCESCGWCVPCRVGNILLRRKLDKILAGRGTARDLKDLEQWGEIVRGTSRCGLGQTSPNPILTTLKNFRAEYEKRLRQDADFLPAFDFREALSEASQLAGRAPEHV